MAQIYTQLNNNNRNGGNNNSTVMVTRSLFGENSSSGLMVRAITKGEIVSTRQKATKIHQIPIKISTGAITIVTIVKGKNCLAVWYEY